MLKSLLAGDLDLATIEVSRGAMNCALRKKHVGYKTAPYRLTITRKGLRIIRELMANAKDTL